MGLSVTSIQTPQTQQPLQAHLRPNPVNPPVAAAHPTSILYTKSAPYYFQEPQTEKKFPLQGQGWYNLNVEQQKNLKHNLQVFGQNPQEAKKSVLMEAR